MLEERAQRCREEGPRASRCPPWGSVPTRTTTCGFPMETAVSRSGTPGRRRGWTSAIACALDGASRPSSSGRLPSRQGPGRSHVDGHPLAPGAGLGPLEDGAAWGPASVSTRTCGAPDSPGTRDRAAVVRARRRRQRTPLPHICARLPSALYISIRASHWPSRRREGRRGSGHRSRLRSDDPRHAAASAWRVLHVTVSKVVDEDVVVPGAVELRRI